MQQGKIILARRLAGESVGSLSKDFGVSMDTIKRRIDEARRAAEVDAAKDRVLTELLGPAIDTFKQLLLEGDYNAARDVLQGLGVLPKNGPATTEVSVKAEMTLDQWREMRIRHDESTAAEAAPEQLSPGNSPAFSEATVLVDGEDDDPAGAGTPDPPGA
jgi:hypothetical protein